MNQLKKSSKIVVGFIIQQIEIVFNDNKIYFLIFAGLKDVPLLISLKQKKGI